MSIGERIREAREATGLGRQRFSKASGVPVSTLVQIELGHIVNPGIFIVAKIASAAGVSIDSLVSPPPRKRRGQRRVVLYPKAA